MQKSEVRSQNAELRTQKSLKGYFLLLNFDFCIQ